jgi:CRISPR/Cas system-associated exonuclease Cas4 (RecB family)
VRAEGWSTVSFSHTHKGEEITIPLHGKLDVVVEEGDEVRVFDYKTREGMSENEIRGLTKNSDGSYFRQLIFYTILLEASHRKNSFINPSLVFVKPDDKGRCPIMTLSVTTEDVSRVKEEIKHLIEIVWSETLLSQTCDNPECKYCK